MSLPPFFHFCVAAPRAERLLFFETPCLGPETPPLLVRTTVGKQGMGGAVVSALGHKTPISRLHQEDV